MKTATYIISTFVYLVAWFWNGFLMGMSHSIPYYKYDQKIYQYYFLIVILELLLFIVFSRFFHKKLKGNVGNTFVLLMTLYLSVMFPWQIMQFTQYGHGYRFLQSIGMNEPLKIILVNALPLLLILLAVKFNERLGDVLFKKRSYNTKIFRTK